MGEGFASNWDKRHTIVVVWAVQGSVGAYLGIGVGIHKKIELAFQLWDDLAPEMGWERSCCSARRRNEMVFPCLDGLLGNVASMIIGWYKLVIHVGFLDSLFILFGCLVVEYLACWHYSTCFHSLECRAAGTYHFSFRLVFGGFHPDGVGAGMV